MQKSEEEITAIEKKRSAIEGFQPVVDIWDGTAQDDFLLSKLNVKEV